MSKGRFSPSTDPCQTPPAKGCDINLLGVIGVSNDAVSPFEVKTRNARPAFPVVV
jgi:hypothetical protein